MMGLRLGSVKASIIIGTEEIGLKSEVDPDVGLIPLSHDLLFSGVDERTFCASRPHQVAFLRYRIYLLL